MAIQSVPVAHIHAAVKANQLVARNTAHIAAVTAHAAAAQTKTNIATSLAQAKINDVITEQQQVAAAANQKALDRRASRKQKQALADAQIQGHIHAVYQHAQNHAAHRSTQRAVARQQAFSGILLNK